MVTRIVAGSAKGRTLRVPKQGTRPTSAKVREALFSKLAAWDLVQETRILDLFAGSGALGLEAFSRGAGSVDFVENSRAAQNVLQTNIGTIGAGKAARLHRMAAEKFLTGERGTWDVVFVDPPYSWDAGKLGALLTQLAAKLSPDGVIVVERDARSEPMVLSTDLIVEAERRWGDTAVYILGLPVASEGEAPPNQ